MSTGQKRRSGRKKWIASDLGDKYMETSGREKEKKLKKVEGKNWRTALALDVVKGDKGKMYKRVSA